MPTREQPVLPAREQRLQRDEADSERWKLHQQAKALGNMLQMSVGPVKSEAQLQSLVTSEIRIRRLRNKLDEMKAMAGVENAEGGEQAEDIHVIGDVSADDFKIERGTNKTTRATDPFDEARVQEILTKIKIGSDLTDEQRAKVSALIREYADVFALSMSEVFYVDWWKHHLNIDPTIKLPTRMSQRPLTEKQKEWFYDILDANNVNQAYCAAYISPSGSSRPRWTSNSEYCAREAKGSWRK